MTVHAIARWLAALLLAASAAAGAHTFHAGITDISFNASTGSIEIVHTYAAHDIEALLTNLYQRQFDLSQAEDEALLRRYVEQAFYIEGAARARLPLRWVGIKVDADNVVVFQELEHTPLAAAAQVHDEVLIDFLAEQTNTLNLSQAGTVRTFTFTRQHTQQKLP